MSKSEFYRLESLSVFDVIGKDACRVINNVTTNDIAKLEIGAGCEAFVTDVRGKTLGHGYVYRTSEGVRYIGSPGQMDALAAHIDRYIIREDATVEPQEGVCGFVLHGESVSSMGWVDLQTQSSIFWKQLPDPLADAVLYSNLWLGTGTCLLLVAGAEAEKINSWLESQSLRLCVEADFHRKRIAIGFPWHGVDFDASNLPQEVDRDDLAISFTKGCYLGQETVARLDAMGQVQKKLVRWSIDGAIPAPQTTISAADKTVGKLTSVLAVGERQAEAIGFARRSHFDAGSIATGTDESTGANFTAQVIAGEEVS